MKRVLSAVAACLFASDAAVAILPASSEQLLCLGSHVIDATVVAARPKDCRIDAQRRGVHVDFCAPSNMLELDIQVREVLATYPDAPRPRAAGDPNGAQRLLVISHVNDAFGAVAERSASPIDVIKDAELFTPENLAKVFVGKNLVFSITVGYIAPSESKRYYANVWSPTSREWILSTLEQRGGRQCAIPIPR
jgi:hypothetical protein